MEAWGGDFVRGGKGKEGGGWGNSDGLHRGREVGGERAIDGVMGWSFCAGSYYGFDLLCYHILFYDMSRYAMRCGKTRYGFTANSRDHVFPLFQLLILLYNLLY